MYLEEEVIKMKYFESPPKPPIHPVHDKFATEECRK